MSTHLERHLRNALGDTYNPKAKAYSILTPDKAANRVAQGGWTHEKTLIRQHANGNEEHLVILSKPQPTPTTTTVVEKVKDIIHGSRKPRS